MTRKHFEALAAEIAKIEDKAAREQAAVAVVNACEKFNPNFDRTRFYATCNVAV